MKYDYAIIGGGASGLMLAALVDINKCGASGVIIESGSSLGSKILMSGGGHCNITHGGSIKDFLQAYGDAGRFLRKCLYRHNNLELIRWLEQDIPTVCDENGRVFPASMKAREVLDFLHGKAVANGWVIRLNTRVDDLRTVDAENVIVACGGITYPETGSDGALFGNMAELGIGIVEPRAALTPLKIKDYPYEELAGISLQDVTVNVYDPDQGKVPASTGFACSKTIPDGRKNEGGYLPNSCAGRAARMSGDMLFTHDGFSGPVILNISKYAVPGGHISIDYGKQLDELPRRLKKFIEDRSRGPSGDIRTRQVAALLANDRFVIDSIDSRGMVTSGGISLEEADPATMEIRPHLYAIGEALDADGITGGYNLQMCYSTAAAVADVINNSNS
ncbi:MAG: NAD(P)/FAD-dependent oxidoreductase [Mogibacterium sp.]|nr:NAD(P)/FAD-dependent oxidoreductase [Mogibacterium sp.]